MDNYDIDDVRAILEKPFPRHWSVHGIGMLRTYLDEARQWRLNLWHPILRNEGISTMHSHPWPFESYVMAGSLQNTRYLRCTKDSRGARLFYEGKITCGISNPESSESIIPGKESLRFPGLNGEPEIVTLFSNDPETYVAGETYGQRADEIHDTSARPGTITIINRGPARHDHEASIFWPVGSPWGDASRDWDQAQAEIVIQSAYEVLCSEQANANSE